MVVHTVIYLGDPEYGSEDFIAKTSDAIEGCGLHANADTVCQYGENL
jgi:hypothetical protein